MVSEGKINRKCKEEVCVIIRCSLACQVRFCARFASLYNLLQVPQMTYNGIKNHQRHGNVRATEFKLSMNASILVVLKSR